MAVTSYRLSLESGPQHRKTVVHVLDLLGCVGRGATTEEALANTPEGIRDYLAFLRRHRERSLPSAKDPIHTEVVIHVTEGTRLGEGDPDGGFAPDFAAFTEDQQWVWMRRLDWMQRDFLELIASVPGDLDTQPEVGRPLRAILAHVADAQYAYLQPPLSKPAGLAALTRAVEEGSDPLGAFAECARLSLDRLAAITEDERTAVVQHGAKQWTTRRALRRMLEHQWEHLVEVRERLGG